MTRQDSAVPARPRPSHDDLNQLKRQAKDLLKLYRAGDAEALAEVQRLYHDADAAFALHDAQLVVARRHGFESWIKLKEHVDRATVAKLARAAEAGDVSRIRAMLKARHDGLSSVIRTLACIESKVGCPRDERGHDGSKQKSKMKRLSRRVAR